MKTIRRTRIDYDENSSYFQPISHLLLQLAIAKDLIVLIAAVAQGPLFSAKPK